MTPSTLSPRPSSAWTVTSVPPTLTLSDVPDLVELPPTPVRRAAVRPGPRLTAAIDALDGFPALADARERVLALIRPSLHRDVVPAAALVSVIESDVALALAVLRAANELPGPAHRGVSSLFQAFELLGPKAILAVAQQVETFEFFEPSDPWNALPEHYRLHALACQRVAARLVEETSWVEPDEFMVTVLLHDVGKLALAHAYPGCARRLYEPACTPQERVRRERCDLGVDHAAVGAEIARRQGLPRRIARLIDHHHEDDVEGEAALLRLTDLLAHHVQGSPVSPTAVLRLARAAAIDEEHLRAVLFDLAGGRAIPHKRRPESCPLSDRELEVLSGLANGKVYKEIGIELGLSASTVRTHLHNVYRKLGACSRAQAVLVASERGWLD